MTYQEQDFKKWIGLTGFSDILLQNHFTLYASYVKNTNKISEQLAALLKTGNSNTPEFAELKRSFGWEFDGMRLHELYFSSMSKTSSSLAKASPLLNKISEDFGSFDQWKADFLATGAMRGIGWVILSYDPVGKKLFNVWINEHDAGHLAGSFPLLVMDVFEHAFMIDYGLKRADYLQSFFKVVDWKEVEKRFKQ